MKAGWLVENYGSVDDVVERLVKAESRSYVRNIAREYKAAQLYGAEVFDFQKEIEDTLKPIFIANGLVLEELLIRQPGFEDDYRDAIESKQIAMEYITTRDYEAQQAKFEADRVAELARGDKEAAIQTAMGKAEAVRLTADAEAYSIREKGKALEAYPSILQLETILSLRDPNSRFRLLVLPQDSILPLLNLNEELGQ